VCAVITGLVFGFSWVGAGGVSVALAAVAPFFSPFLLLLLLLLLRPPSPGLTSIFFPPPAMVVVPFPPAVRWVTWRPLPASLSLLLCPLFLVFFYLPFFLRLVVSSAFNFLSVPLSPFPLLFGLSFLPGACFVIARPCL